MYISFDITLSLSALIFICSSDSSPDTYKILPYLVAILLAACKSIVDFPMPGDPDIRVKDPLTMPPPKTLFSSFIPVSNLSYSLDFIVDIILGSDLIFIFL